MTMVIRLAALCAITIGLAACADSPQPTMHLRPVRQVNLDMMPSRTIPHTLIPTAR